MPFEPSHPDQIHSGVWDAETKRPVVDGKIEDPLSGEVREISKGGLTYGGPPDVDITITNLHGESTGTFRIQSPFPFEKLLFHIMKVVDQKKIELHSLTATSYSITVVLADDLSEKGGFNEVAIEMANGIWGH